MNKLLNTNRTGGFPLTGEALQILSEELEKWLLAIFNSGEFGGLVSGLELIFFRNANYPVNNQNIQDGELIYCRTFGFCELTNVSQLNINYLDLINDAVSVNPIIADIISDDTNQLGTFTATRKYQRLQLNIVQNSLFKAYDFKEFVKWTCFSATKKLDLSICKIYTGTTIGFNGDNIIGVTPYSGQYGFYGTNNKIERVGNFLYLNFNFATIAGGIGTTVKNIIEMPASFCNFTRITRIKSSLLFNDVNVALYSEVRAVAIKNYIIMETTGGTPHCVVDFIPIS